MNRAIAQSVVDEIALEVRESTNVTYDDVRAVFATVRFQEWLDDVLAHEYRRLTPRDALDMD